MAVSGKIEQIAAMFYSGQIGEAETACLDVLEKFPNDYMIRGLLSQIYAMEGKFEEAVATVLKALRVKPRDVQLLAMYGSHLMHQGRNREALAQFDKALKYKPDYDAAICSKADTYLRMGKTKKAREVIEKVGDKTRTSFNLGLLHGRVLLKCGEAKNAARLLQGLLPVDQKVAIDLQATFWHLLGQAHEKLEQWEQAFQAYQIGNAAHPKLSASNDTIQKKYDALKSTFTRELLESLPRAKVDSSRFVFIIGMPRCGSTLTEQIIDCHPQAHGIGESNRMPRVADTIAQRFGFEQPFPLCCPSLDQAQVDELANDYIDFVSVKAGNARRIIDKQLGNIQQLGLIQALLPEARIIHCRRHPMDQGLSCWTLKMPASMSQLDELDSIGHFFKLTDDLFEHWNDVLSLPIMEVRYEDMVQDTEGMARQIIDFCGLEWDPACLRFWENKRVALTLSQDQVRQPIYDTAKGRHVAWGDLLDPLREALGDSIQEYEAGPAPRPE